MASKQTGKAVIFGCAGTITIATATITLLNQGADFSANHQVDEIIDEDNEVLGLVHSHELIDATLSFIPVGGVDANNTKAKAKDALVKPSPGDVVALSGFAAPAGGGDWKNKNWSYVGGFKTVSRNNGVTTYEMNIRRSPNNDITTAIA